MRPVSRPALNQRTRCWELPCVKASGTTRPAAFLHHVVADLRRGVQPLLDVAGLQALLHLVVEVRPHAGQAVRLQLHAHLQRWPSRFVIGAVLQLLHLVGDAEQVCTWWPTSCAMT